MMMESTELITEMPLRKVYILLLLFFFSFFFRIWLSILLFFLADSAEPTPHVEPSGAARHMSESPPHIKSPVYDRNTGELLDPLFSYERTVEALFRSDSPASDGMLEFLSFSFFLLYIFLCVHTCLSLLASY